MFKSASILILFISCLLACGGSETSDGYLLLQIENARLPSGLSKASTSSPFKTLEVARFKVTIEGPGIETPIIAEASAASDKIKITGIPAGDDRTILIEAFNEADKVIRRRELNEIPIKRGVIAPLKTRLNTVPLFLKPGDGAVTLADRLNIEGFGEPGAVLKIEASAASSSVSLSGSAGGQVISPSIATGLFDLDPPQRLSGKQRLTVIDETTGESSSITIVVVDKERPGRQFVSAASLNPAVSVGPAVGGARTSNFPLVLEALNDEMTAR